MQEGIDENDASRCNRSEGLTLSRSSSSAPRNKLKKVAENKDLPHDLLNIICKKLSFDDLFQFAGVCRSWRLCHKTYWKAFMESKSPFIVEKASHAKKSLSLISLHDEKAHRLQLDNFWVLAYCASSSGYLIFAGPNTLLLLNPFTRREKKVSTLDLKIKSDYKTFRVLLAFVKGSRQFVIVVYSTQSLNVYQSLKNSWDTNWKWGKLWKIVHVVIFHNDIYIITSNSSIGRLNLNLMGIKFLKLRNHPRVYSNNLRLVKDDENLLVVHFEPKRILDVYKVDFSKMEYVKLNTLGDLALFYSPLASCHALSNPRIWGYYNNHVYSICGSEAKCEVYSWSSNLVNVLPHDHGLQVSKGSRLYWWDWCFRNLYDEVKYSLA